VHEGAGLDGLAADGLGPPLLPVHPHHAQLVEAGGDRLEHAPGLADEPLRADAVGGLALVEAAGQWAEPGEGAEGDADEGQPLAQQADLEEGEDGGDGGADGEGGEEERAGDRQLPAGEDHRRRQPDPAPRLGLVHRAVAPLPMSVTGPNGIPAHPVPGDDR
jgi:hypothetical protein